MTDLSKQADTLGYPAIVPQCRSGSRYLHNQRLGKVQIKAPDAIDLKFLNYLFRTSEYRHEVLASATGTTVKHTSPERIKRFKFFRPPLDEQRAIAHILGTLDDKIELNWRMNETLAAMSRALFKSWFVDFDPVRVKVEGRNGPLPETIGAHFPHRFSKGKEGRIPEGWFNRELGELVDLQRGTTYKSGLKHLPGPVLLGLASIERNGGFRDRNLSTYGGPSPANLILRPGDMYASLKDVTQSADLLGAVAKVPPYIEQGRLTQDTVKLIFKSAKTSRHIVYQTLLSDDYRVYCRAHATGTTNLGLSRDDFLAFPILQPSEKVQRLFDDAIEQLECRMAIAVGNPYPRRSPRHPPPQAHLRRTPGESRRENARGRCVSDAPSRGELILYRTEDGRDTIRLRAVDGTVWGTSTESEISYGSVVKESLTTVGEQDELATCKDFLQVQPKRLTIPEADP